MAKILTEIDSVANTYLAELRDAELQKDPLKFRNNLRRLGRVFGFEISKTLSYNDVEVETPLGIANTKLSQDRIVLATILRAGLPLYDGLLDVFDRAGSAFISAYRRHHKDGTFEINMPYVTCPNLDDTILILADPMLATGASLDQCLEALNDYGTPKEIHIVTAIASKSGVGYIKRHRPKVQIWIGDVDEELTAKSYIVPGLGDAGDLAFGPKLQE